MNSIAAFRSLRQTALRRGLLASALLISASSAHATAVVFSALGTLAPPATIGGHVMTPFGPTGIPDGTGITSWDSPLGGSLVFDQIVDKVSIGNGWATWSHGYTGEVARTNSTESLFITLPPKTKAFYLYVEPNQFATYDITVTAEDGSFIQTQVAGEGGAYGFGAFDLEGGLITSLAISGPGTGGLGVGEFGIASIPLPTTLLLLSLGLGVMAGRRVRD